MCATMLCGKYTTFYGMVFNDTFIFLKYINNVILAESLVYPNIKQVEVYHA